MKNKTLTIVLALFLGHFGGHYFYLEKPLKGVLMAMFFWTFIPSIIALCQAFWYLTMTDEQFNAYAQK